MPPTLYDRQQLLDDVWTTPVSHLTTKYGLSDAGLKKLCSRLQIPTPPRGYWAKLKAGKRVPSKPSLVEYTGAPYYLYQPQRPATSTPTPDPTREDSRLAAVISYESDAAHRIAVSARLNNPHAFVKLTQQALKTAPLDQRGQPAALGGGIHLRVSEGMQQRALLIADALLKAVDKRVFQLWQDKDGVALLFHGLTYRLEFFESCKRVPYQPSEAEQRRRKAGHYVYTPPWSFLPSGVLTLQTGNGYGPKVTDGKGRQVESLLNAFLIRVATHGVATLRASEERAV